MQVSFVVPVYNTEYRLLAICINSILDFMARTGNVHQLVIVDDASSSSATREFLDKCSIYQGPQHITVLRNNENSGVSYSLNKAVTACSGNYVAPVDHDDLVIPEGLAIALRHLRYNRAVWAYTDELQVDAKGFLLRYMYKPDYSKQLLRSLMYINHLQLYTREFFEAVGGYREGFEGAQDYDLALRMSEKSIPFHVPQCVAYQWRILDTTQSRTAGNISEEIAPVSLRSLNDHFLRNEQNFECSQVRETLPVFKSRMIPKQIPKISIVIPCKVGTKIKIDNKEIELLPHCLQSIQATIQKSTTPTLESPLIEMILVINQEDDVEKAHHALEHYGFTGSCIADQSGFNFSRKCNLGARHATGNMIVFLNDDTQFLSRGWTSDVISLLSEEDVAVVGGMLLNSEGTVQACGDNVGRSSAVHYDPQPIQRGFKRFFPPSALPDDEGDSMQRYLADHETTSITGAFFCCRKSVFTELDGFSDAFPNSFQDVDFCLRARKKNLRCVVTPHIRIVHHESASRDSHVDPETLQLLRTTHRDSVLGLDPYALWFYQPVRAPWRTLGGLMHRIRLFREAVVDIFRDIKKQRTKHPLKRYPETIS